MTASNNSSLWDGLHKELVSFVYKKVKDKATAEDIVQDVFIKAHTRIDQLKEPEKINGWIFQIARNAIIDHYRKASRNIKPASIDWESDFHAYNDCVGQCLKILMTTLPDTYRIPLELTETESLSQNEIAERLNISYSGARSRIQRARKILREKFEALYFIESDAYGNIIVCENRMPCSCTGETC